MPGLFEILALAVVQGVTEFLPVSSSGHLAVLSRMMGVAPGGAVEIVVALHAGTLVSIAAYYFRDLLRLLTRSGVGLVPKIIAASIPAGVVGALLHMTHMTDKIFGSLLIPGVGLLITSSMLLNASKKTADTSYPMKRMGFREALLIGLAQCVAILPGVSRSGATISAALRTGMVGRDAAEFSFFIAIPAIAGATLLEALSKAGAAGFEMSVSLPHVAAGFAVSAVVGYISLTLLVAVLKKARLNWFAYYCLVMGSIVTMAGIREMLSIGG